MKQFRKVTLFKGLFIVVALQLATLQPGFAVTANFSGQFRTEGALYNKLNLGVTGPHSKAFLSTRALLNPKIVIDDHFSLNGQFNVAQSPRFTAGNEGNGLGVGNGGYIYGDPSARGQVSRFWLEWVSDFGVVRLGRMPISWGYGLVYDAGNSVWDDFQSVLDRLEYRLHFGHLVGAVAYSKGRKISTIGNDNDQEFYTIYLRYDNPEEDLEWGGMFERQVRSSTQGSALAAEANPYYINSSAVPLADPKRPPLATSAPYPQSNNLFDVYFKRSFGGLSFGGEGAWLSGSAIDFNNNGVEDSLNAFGVMLNVSYESQKIKGFLDFLYASGDTAINSDRLNGFVLLHRNRRPGLILGRELLGNYANSSVGQGSLVYYGQNSGATTSSFSGAYYFRPGVRFEWSPSWASGIELIIAQKAATSNGESANLGVEVDLGTDHEFYKNFDIGLNLGYLFPGQGLGVASPEGVFAFRTTAVVKF